MQTVQLYLISFANRRFREKLLRIVIKNLLQADHLYLNKTLLSISC